MADLWIVRVWNDSSDPYLIGPFDTEAAADDVAADVERMFESAGLDHNHGASVGRLRPYRADMLEGLTF